MHHAEHNCVLHMQVYVNTIMQTFQMVTCKMKSASTHVRTYLRTACLEIFMLCFFHFIVIILCHDIFVECDYP